MSVGTRWLALMIPYCILFLVIDSLVVWSVINWFNAKLRYADILPIRASAYILSLVNEQVSKGAIAFYLNRRDGVPGWEVGSSMLFIMFCEYYYLLTWATIGVMLQWDRFPKVFHADSLDCPRLWRFLRALPSFLQRENWLGDGIARPADLPVVPAGESLALRGCRRAALAPDHRWRRRTIRWP